MTRHIIFVPGLGDYRSFGQNIGIQLWRLFGLTPHYLALGWNVKEGYEVKQQRLTKLIDTLRLSGTVSLVGVSAGASAVLNTYAASDNIEKVVCISGKINNPQTIGPGTLLANHDFGESMKRLAASLKAIEDRTQNIMSIHPVHDQVVPIADTIIPGAREKTVPGRSHASGIFFGIVFGAFSIVRFVRSGK